MPRYHFHLQSSIGLGADADGRDMPDDTSAVRDAGSTAGEVLIDELTAGNVAPKVAVTVERSDGTKVAIVKAYAEVEIF